MYSITYANGKGVVVRLDLACLLQKRMEVDVEPCDARPICFDVDVVRCHGDWPVMVMRHRNSARQMRVIVSMNDKQLMR